MVDSAAAPSLDSVLTDDFLEAARQRGDSLADPVIRRIADAAGGPPRIRHLLADLALAADVPALRDAPDGRSADIAPILSEYIDHSGQLPPWLDERLLLKAQRFFQEHGFVAFVLLGTSCLPELYTCGNGGTQVLEVTHALVEGAARRIHQTAHIITNVMAPEGLKTPNSPGVRSLQKVRLMHACVRYLALAPPPAPSAPEQPQAPAGVHPKEYQELAWDSQWGTPIGQEYMAGTLQTFSYVILRGIKDLAILPARVVEDSRCGSESAAYVHAWNVAGYLLGVEEEFLLPVRTYADSQRLFERVMARNVSKTPEQQRAGTVLTQALIRYMHTLLDDQTLGALELLPGLHLPQRIPKYMIRRMLGRQRADLLLELDRIDRALYGPWNTAVTVVTHRLVRSRFRNLIRKLLCLDIYSNICLLDPDGCPPEFDRPTDLLSLWVKSGTPPSPPQPGQ